MSGDGELRTIRMQSFPAAWLTLEADTFLKKIQALLLRFGALQEEPIIVDKSGPDGVVVKATYAKGSDALSAKDCLHGVDMRPQAEKQRSAPTEKDKFQVQLVCGEDAKKTQQSTPDVKPGPPFARRALRPGETTYHLRLRGLAAEWTQDMIKELCDQYGAIKRVTADGKGAFVVSFASTDASKSACDCLEGLRLENDGGTCSIIQARLLPERKDGDMEVDEVPLDLLPSALSENGGPIVAYVDELQLAKGEPRPEDREVFLRELPLEDYTEMQLREWLSGFGSVTACHFVRSPQTQELTGCGYVTFASHAEAAGLLAAFPQGSDNDGNVKGSWSLSERMLQGEQGLFKADVVGAISKCIRQTRIDIASAALLFVGGAAEPSPALSDWELGSGPLHFVCSGRHRFSSRGELRDHLADLVSNVLADAFLGKDSGIADMAPTDLGLEAEPTTPCILLHGFPASWAEQQVRLVFSVFGGISSVRFMPAPNNPKSRVALVELKDPSNTVKAVGELDNSQVGDGELIEECTVACKAFGVSSAPSVSFYYVFLDEIVNLSQPQVSPGKGDREVFVQSLPVEDCSEDQIRTWLEGFGPVEDMYLLRDQATNELNGKGYVGYKTHAAACACIQAQASVQDAEDGDVVARWSESERAQQQKESVYGADLCAVAFPQRALDSIRRRVKAKNVWLLGSDRHPPKPRREGQPVPKAVASQFHFVVDCDAEAQVEDIRRELSKMMTDFQRRQDTKAAVPPSVNGVPPPTHQPQNMTPGPATGSSTPWMPFGWRPYGPPPTGWMPPGYAQAPLAPPLAGNGELGSGWGAPTPPTDTLVVPDRSQQETEEGHTSRHRRRKEKNKKEKKAKRRKSQEGEEGKVQEGEEGNVQEGDEVKADVQQEGGVQQKDDPEPPSGTETPPETTKPPPEDADWGTPELQNKDDRARSTSGSRRAKRSRSHDCAKSEDNDKNSTADPGDARDRKRSKSPSNARDQQRSKSRGDARQSSRSRGDAGDRQRSKSRGGGDRQRSKSRGDTRDRERSKSRGDARDRQRSISRGDTRDRQRSKSRGDVRDRHRSKSRGGARDRQRSKSRGDARQRSRSRGDARDRRRSKSRGGARQRSKSRGASRDRQRSKSRDRRDRGRNRSRSRKGRGARGGHRNSDDRSRARRDDSRPRRDDRDRDRR